MLWNNNKKNWKICKSTPKDHEKNPKTAEAPYYKINFITLIPLLHRILSYYNAKICSVYWIFLYEIINCIVANQQQDTFSLKLYASTIKYNHCEWQNIFRNSVFPLAISFHSWVLIAFKSVWFKILLSFNVFFFVPRGKRNGAACHQSFFTLIMYG